MVNHTYNIIRRVSARFFALILIRFFWGATGWLLAGNDMDGGMPLVWSRIRTCGNRSSPFCRNMCLILLR